MASDLILGGVRRLVYQGPIPSQKQLALRNFEVINAPS